MIRREMTLADGEKLWLLISQVDHAHLSGELVRCWQEPFAAAVTDAIAHHDDGWAAWEAEPKLNPEIGAPYSFLEMPVPAALVIWDHSIESAGKFGPLAAYIVAGHFYTLLSQSDHADDPLAVAWLTAKRKLRTVWLDEWVRADPRHSLDRARSAQEMLMMADLFSLWLCCEAPVDSGSRSILSGSSMKLQTDTLLSRFRFSVPEFVVRTSARDERVEKLQWTVAVDPYPFQIEPLSLAAGAIAAPAVRYASWKELEAASWPVELQWRLVDDSSPAAPG